MELRRGRLTHPAANASSPQWTAPLCFTYVCVAVFPRSQGESVSIMPLFGKSHKSPADIVRTLKENLAILVKQDKKTDKVKGDSVCVCKCLVVSRPKGGSPL